MVKRTFAPKGVCSKRIDFDLDEGLVRNIRFEGGCDGNLQGVARLAEGRRVSEVVELLSGIKCGQKSTSCPDQLARALKKRAKAKENI